MDLYSLEFPLLIFTVIANIAIDIIILLYAKNSQGRNYFVLFVLSQTIWIVVNYFSFQVTNEQWLFMARLTLLSAVPHPVLFFLFIYTFLRKEPIIKKWQQFLFFSLMLALGILALSPYLFTQLGNRNGVLVPIPGPGMAVFGFYVVSFIGAAFFVLFKRWKK